MAKNKAEETQAKRSARMSAYIDAVQEELSNRVAQEQLEAGAEEAKKLIDDALEVVTKYDDTITRAEKEEIKRVVLNEFLEYGSIQHLLDDETITEIIINGYDDVMIERDGKLKKVKEDLFPDDKAVQRLIDRIASENNKHCDNQEPKMDARLKDGSRVNAIIPPLARFGPSVTIRKFPNHRLHACDLVRVGSASLDLVNFLACCVEARLNILVSGGTGTGKTTLLNILSAFIPQDEGYDDEGDEMYEHIVTIEDTAELKLVDKDGGRRLGWTSLEARDANADGEGRVTIHQLVVNALRMRPDRIIVGECRSDETVEMLQAMNTGHDGSLTTIHANDPRAAFLRIQTMVQATQNLSERNINMQIATAIQIVVQLKRYKDGTRKISEVMALTGTMEGDTITTTELFRFEEEGVDEDGRIIGRHVASGSPLPESIMERIEQSGAYFDERWLGLGDVEGDD